LTRGIIKISITKDAQRRIMLYGKEISILVAMDENGLIGRINGDGKGHIPWPHIREDMSRFVHLTENQSLVLGRVTWESLPEKVKPFDRGRETIVLSRNTPSSVPPAVKIAFSFEDAVRIAARKQVFAIGGVGIYASALPYADTMYITHIHGRFKGNVLFPQYEKKQWKLTEHKSGSADTATGKIKYDFATYTRVWNQQVAA
jgi:dihydrofolate reductase